jgi:acylphosphatase
MKVCKLVHYWGKVQGVGFRYTAYGLAQQHQVAGYVKNMLDGQVELVVEGEALEVDRYLSRVSGKMADFIEGQKVEDETPQEFTDFAIR